MAQLLAKAEQADSTPLQDGLTIPAEITRRQDRIAQLQRARAVIEQRARQRAAQRKRPAKPRLLNLAVATRARDEPPPPASPQAKDQFNFTDPESRIMKAGNGAHFEQAYNAQAALETDSRLLVATRVTDAPNDKQQLVPTVAAVPGLPSWPKWKLCWLTAVFIVRRRWRRWKPTMVPQSTPHWKRPAITGAWRIWNSAAIRRRWRRTPNPRPAGTVKPPRVAPYRLRQTNH